MCDKPLARGEGEVNVSPLMTDIDLISYLLTQSYDNDTEWLSFQPLRPFRDDDSCALSFSCAFSWAKLSASHWGRLVNSLLRLVLMARCRAAVVPPELGLSGPGNLFTF